MKPLLTNIVHCGNEIGRGGYGTVFKSDAIAIKMVPFEYAFSALLEIATMRALSGSDYLTIVLNAAVGDGDIQIHMNLYGRNMDKYGPISADNARSVSICILNAIAHMHHVGLYHGDVKPGNLMITSDAPLSVILGDFGLSSVNRGRTACHVVMQTAWYRAPEVNIYEYFIGDPFAVDMWAVGCTIHEIGSSGNVLFICSNDDTSVDLSIWFRVYAGPALTPYERLCAMTDDFHKDSIYRFITRDKSVYDETVRDVVTGCLRIDPSRRCTASDALIILNIATADACPPVPSVHEIISDNNISFANEIKMDLLHSASELKYDVVAEYYYRKYVSIYAGDAFIISRAALYLAMSLFQCDDEDMALVSTLQEPATPSELYIICLRMIEQFDYPIALMMG
jgi:serine/threonine protein kinase